MGLFRRKTFRHGVHPPESKDATRGERIRQFPFAPVLVVPLSQHIGKPAKPVVREGQEVARGQVLAEADGWMSVAMHAPASGVIKRIGLAPSAKGSMVPSVFLEPFPGSTQDVAEGQPCGWKDSSEEILTAIQQAGIVGLGGAAFPTHVKLAIPDDKPVDVVIINGVECEPWLTTDHRVMLEQTADVFRGIRYLLAATGAGRAIVGIERNKLDAAAAMTAAIPDDLPLTVEVLPVKYPQGAEKMLITVLLGREVPSRKLPLDVGAVCVNVATTAEIGRLLPAGRGIQERVITVTGPGVKDPGNYRIPIGTPLRFLMETVGMQPTLSRVFMGGPMMGPAVSHLDIPVVKGTSGIVAFTEEQTGAQVAQPEQPCIRCGYCVDACPIFLNPSQLGVLARKGRYGEMRDDFGLFDCFECGSCTFVCPSHIPLVQRFRVAKANLRKVDA